MRAAGQRHIWYRSRRQKFRIWYVADIHWMNKGCAESRLREDLAEIQKDPASFWIGGGDYADFIGYRDWRFDPDSVAEWVKVSELGDLGMAAMRQLADLFRPIAHKCLGLLIGNHEKKYELATEHESLHGWLCSELGVPDLGYCALFDTLFCRTSSVGPVPELRPNRPPKWGGSGEWRIRIFCHHGAGYAQTPGGKVNRLVQFMNSFDADLFFCGHVHDVNCRREVAITADRYCRKLIQRERLGVMPGGYLKTYEQDICGYGEQRGYKPAPLGPAVVEINPETRVMKAIT